jgi:hypothetical protein
VSEPHRPKGEYWLIALFGVLALGLGLGVGVAKYISSTAPGATDTPAASSGPTTSRVPTPSPSTNPTATWTSYSDAADQFSLRYPSSWQQRTCAAGGHTTLYLAPTTANLGACNSDFGGMMSAGASAGDQRSTYRLSSSGYDGLTTTDVTVAGVTGTRQAATVSGSSDAALGPSPGTKVVQYLFNTGGRTYRCLYSQDPSTATAQADFDLMVKNTLAFTP